MTITVSPAPREELAAKKMEPRTLWRLPDSGPDKGFASPAGCGSDDDDNWRPFR